MELSKEKIIIIAAASTVATAAAAVATGGIIGEAVYGTVHVIDAARATKKFKNFASKNGQMLKEKRDFDAVRNFVNNPRGAKLIATPSKNGDAFIWSFEYYNKQSWDRLKKNKKEFEQKKKEWKNKNCKFDFDAVLQFLKYAEEQLKKTQPSTTQADPQEQRGNSTHHNGNSKSSQRVNNTLTESKKSDRQPNGDNAQGSADTSEVDPKLTHSLGNSTMVSPERTLQEPMDCSIAATVSDEYEGLCATIADRNSALESLFNTLVSGNLNLQDLNKSVSEISEKNEKIKEKTDKINGLLIKSQDTGALNHYKDLLNEAKENCDSVKQLLNSFENLFNTMSAIDNKIRKATDEKDPAKRNTAKDDALELIMSVEIALPKLAKTFPFQQIQTIVTKIQQDELKQRKCALEKINIEEKINTGVKNLRTAVDDRNSSLKSLLDTLANGDLDPQNLKTLLPNVRQKNNTVKNQIDELLLNGDTLDEHGIRANEVEEVCSFVNQLLSSAEGLFSAMSTANEKIREAKDKTDPAKRNTAKDDALTALKEAENKVDEISAKLPEKLPKEYSEKVTKIVGNMRDKIEQEKSALTETRNESILTKATRVVKEGAKAIGKLFNRKRQKEAARAQGTSTSTPAGQGGAGVTAAAATDSQQQQ